MLVDGSHTGKDGIINRNTFSTLDTGAALHQGLPTYNHDAGFAEQVLEKLQPKFKHDARFAQIAGFIDAIGTMRALGVENIAARA